jgi:hypothetical protein
MNHTQIEKPPKEHKCANKGKKTLKREGKRHPNGAKMHDPTKFPGQGGWAKKISGRISALRRLIMPP